jgi:hypothetical protein
MRATMVLSIARSGTTFFSSRLNGMLGFKDKDYHNELAFEEFFIKNKMEHLIKYDKVKYTKPENRRINFNPKIHQKLLQPRKYSENCYYSTDQLTLETAVRQSLNPVFNVHIFQISKNYNLIKNIKSPILFLIRKNNWQRMISQYLFNKKITPSHLISESVLKQIDIEISKSDLDEIITHSDYQVNLIKTFQKELKDQENVKFVYYEDIENKAFWTNEFIDQLEDFMQVKFTDRNYAPSFTKTRDSVNLINKEEVMNQDLIEKYYIKEI